MKIAPVSSRSDWIRPLMSEVKNVSGIWFKVVFDVENLKVGESHE